MELISDFSTAVAAIRAFERERWSMLPAHVQAKMDELGGVGVSPVDRVVKTAELLYANRGDALTRNQDRLMAAGLIQFATMNGFHGLAGEEQRGMKIEHALRRDAGEEGFDQPAEDDPEPKAEYLPAPTTED